VDKERIIAEAVLHRDDDVARLLLSGNGNDNLRLVAQQIEGWRTAREKWPTLSQNDAIWYPPRINCEQSSSETTARYKALLLNAGDQLADLTGGMGIDSLFAAMRGIDTDYVEQDAMLCAAMEHNLKALRLANCRCHCADSMTWIEQQKESYDTIYLDPARRGRGGRRVAAFEDCTPNLLQHIDMLMQHCRRLIVKAAPMIDLAAAERQLCRYLTATHIVAVHGECKEVLFVCEQETRDEVMTHCIDLTHPLTDYRCNDNHFSFSHAEEAAAEVEYCGSVGHYLYEPNAALMKGGAFKSIGQRYAIGKLARNTHLYSADTLIEQWPGRVFEVMQEIRLTVKNIRIAIPEGKAHVVARNYPVAAADLQRQLKLQEGGTEFVVATTIGTRKIGLLCRRVK